MAYSSSSDGLGPRDLEHNAVHQFLMNDSVQSFSWNDLTVTVKDRRTKQPRNLIENINGDVQQGALAHHWSQKGNRKEKKSRRKVVLGLRG
jgi:hypothetical protein